MFTRLAVLLHSKIGVALLGALLVAGGGATVVAAASHGNLGASGEKRGLASAATSTAQKGDDGNHPSAQGTLTMGATPGAKDDDQDNQGEDAGFYGTIRSVDVGHSSFVLTTSTGDVTVIVSDKTTYDDGMKGLTDLHGGQKVAVDGVKQSDGTVAASSIEAGDIEAGDDDGAQGTQTPESTHTGEPTHTANPEWTPGPTHTPGND